MNEEPPTQRVTTRDVLRLLSLQLPFRRGTETLFETRGPESDEEKERERIASENVASQLSTSGRLTAVTTKYVIAAHASDWGKTKPVCGAEPPQIQRTKMRWGAETGARDKMRRCQQCLLRRPID